MSAIEALVTELARLPGIGRKTAQRLTFHLLQQPPDQVVRLAARPAGGGGARASLRRPAATSPRTARLRHLPRPAARRRPCSASSRSRPPCGGRSRHRVSRALPCARRPALAARGDRVPRRSGSTSCVRRVRAGRRARGHPRHQSVDGGRGDRDLPAAAARRPGGAGHPARAGAARWAASWSTWTASRWRTR